MKPTLFCTFLFMGSTVLLLVLLFFYLFFVVVDVLCVCEWVKICSKSELLEYSGTLLMASDIQTQATK